MPVPIVTLARARDPSIHVVYLGGSSTRGPGVLVGTLRNDAAERASRRAVVCVPNDRSRRRQFGFSVGPGTHEEVRRKVASLSVWAAKRTVALLAICDAKLLETPRWL